MKNYKEEEMLEKRSWGRTNNKPIKSNTSNNKSKMLEKNTEKWLRSTKILWRNHSSRGCPIKPTSRCSTLWLTSSMKPKESKGIASKRWLGWNKKKLNLILKQIKYRESKMSSRKKSKDWMCTWIPLVWLLMMYKRNWHK